MKQTFWIVRCKMPEGHWVYLDDYVSWHSEGSVKSKLWHKAISEGSKKTADEILKEYNWEIYKVEFEDGQ